MPMHITSPLTRETLETLRSGDSVLLSGILYTARDAAHARLCAALAEGRPLPVDLRGQTVFYAGPTPTPPGKASGAIGPTTSARMDPYTPQLLAYGVAAIIGKGERSPAVRQAFIANGAVYFAAVAGCAAHMAACVKSVEIVAYDDLGTESIKRLAVENLPLTVALDTQGGDFYQLGRALYLQEKLTPNNFLE